MEKLYAEPKNPVSKSKWRQQSPEITDTTRKSRKHIHKARWLDQSPEDEETPAYKTTPRWEAYSYNFEGYIL